MCVEVSERLGAVTGWLGRVSRPERQVRLQPGLAGGVELAHPRRTARRQPLTFMASADPTIAGPSPPFYLIVAVTAAGRHQPAENLGGRVREEQALREEDAALRLTAPLLAGPRSKRAGR